ncbi:putative sulfate transporter [Paraburkholderia domus]|uniref:Sulfate transporter n=1 Tax=Paraburkholderia domus TaxID=2793075 RepID=A0A9N8R3G2_9BURK|nr:putative sulfate transporter [Paraburkholderia domus]CAE6947617.1 putative sulfate transporter [Paraburkholderia domus]
MGASLGTVTGGDVTRFGALAACTALLVTGMAILASLMRAGKIVNFISETVLVGFKTGVALFIGSTQLPNLFGFKGGHGDFLERMADFFTQVRQTNPTALAMGVVAPVVLVFGQAFLKNRPVALLVVIGGVVAASLMDAGAKGVKLLGTIPQGLPPLGLPAVHWSDVDDLLPLAMACFVLGAVETIAIGRMFAHKHGYRLAANQEFLALAAANVGAGLGRGFPVSGGMSQSLVNESGGARTPLSGLVASLIILVVVLFFSDLLRNLPQPVLAAIVLVAVAGLFKFDEMKRLWRFDRREFAIAAAALVGVLTTSLLRGVLIGAVISIVLLLRRASEPPVALPGRVPGTELYGNIAINPENLRTDGVFVFRADAAILYFNCEFLYDRFLEWLAQETGTIKLAIWSLSTVAAVDLAGSEMLVQLRDELAQRCIVLELADARGPVREDLRAAGLEAHFGPIEANASIAGIIRAKQS